MLIGGFWHGASFNYIVWGGLHGTALALQRAKTNISQRAFITVPYSPRLTKLANKLLFQTPLFAIPYSPLLTKYLKVFITFHFVCFCWIFFRCNTFTGSTVFIGQIVNNFNIGLLPQLLANYASVFVMLLIAFLLHSVPISTENDYQKFLAKLSVPLKVVYLFMVIYLAIQFKQSAPIQPIYLQF